MYKDSSKSLVKGQSSSNSIAIGFVYTTLLVEAWNMEVACSLNKFRDRSFFLPEGVGSSYQQNTSQKHMTPLCQNKKCDDPPLGYTKKWWPPAYATIMVIPNNNTK